MVVRRYEPNDKEQLQAMALALLPTEPDYDFTDEHVFVWDMGQGRLGGYASVSVRPWSEASETAPVPHIEGWYVLPSLRQSGVGARLIEAIEQWCIEAGFSELGSDAALENFASIEAHTKLGFELGLRLQYFRKRLR